MSMVEEARVEMSMVQEKRLKKQYDRREEDEK